MRISDWSSDVCSSDLNTADAFTAHEHNVISDEALRTATGFGDDDAPDDTMDPAIAMVLALVQEAPALAANPGMPALLEQMQMLLAGERSEEHTSELQSLMRISYAVFCLKKKHLQITPS